MRVRERDGKGLVDGGAEPRVIRREPLRRAGRPAWLREDHGCFVGRPEPIDGGQRDASRERLIVEANRPVECDHDQPAGVRPVVIRRQSRGASRTILPAAGRRRRGISTGVNAHRTADGRFRAP